MLYRSLFSSLQNWKSRPHHPLIIRGLRQVGKTCLVRQFGSECYPHCVYLDLRANRAVHQAFTGDFNVDQMVMAISAVERSARFVPHETLIIFDEIQDCPEARSSLKFWDLDGRYDVIATGSFLGIKGFGTPYSRGIPVGYEEQLTMYPLTFAGFLINASLQEEVMDYVRSALFEHRCVQNTIHESLRRLYRQYLIVGGMPEVVKGFLDNHDLNAVRATAQGIMQGIRDDFGRYRNAKGDEAVNEVLKLRAEACLDSLSAQLAKEYKKFQYSLVNVRGHSPEKADGLQYLQDVGLVVRACNTSEISSPLEGVKLSDEFKIFYIDTGLMVSQLGDEQPLKILNRDLSAYKGALAENQEASAFAKCGRRLYYYRGRSGSPQLDFLYEDQGEVIIVECKAPNNKRATSMKFVLSKPQKYSSHAALKFTDTNVGTGHGFITLPLYAVEFVCRREEAPMVTPVEVQKLGDYLPSAAARGLEAGDQGQGRQT